MSFDVAGKRVVVTGASSGIGAELAERFASMGATVGICARRADRLREVLERCQVHSPGSVMWVCDMADREQVAALPDAVRGDLGDVDVLVNNAGIPKRRHVTELIPDEVELVTRVNYLAAVELTLALLPGMVERGDRELYVPAYFKDLAVGKAGNVAAFLEGAAQFVRETRYLELAGDSRRRRRESPASSSGVA